MTHWHALLIANNEVDFVNDHIETALRNWNSWRVNGTITKRDNRTGAQVIADINAWVAGIDEDDVALFWYIGHGGIQADAAGGGADERVNDPGGDNDPSRNWDEILGQRNARRVIIAPASDDEMRAALGALPAGTTLMAVFNM